ncbi:MAG TPA: hypothetical protein VGN37_06840 [Actinocatenispora sp.]
MKTVRKRYAVALAATAVACVLAGEPAGAAPALTSAGEKLGAPDAAPAAASGTAVDPDAPAGGTVPGATGADARAAVGAAGTHFGAVRQQGTGLRAAATEHHENYQWTTKANAYGVIATQSVDPTIKIPSTDDETVYAPTMVAGGESCIELSTIYYHGAATLGAWNWCGKNPGFDKTTGFTSTFMSTYTKKVGGHSYYGAKINRTDKASNTWTAWLYNRKTSKWDTFFTSKGTGKKPGHGWDMFETYNHVDAKTGNAYYCAAIKGHRFETTDVQFYVNGGWKHVTKADMNIAPSASPDAKKDFHCSGLTFTYRNDGWVVSR